MICNSFPRRAIWLLSTVVLLTLPKSSFGMGALSKEFEDYMVQNHYGAVALKSSERVWGPQTLEAKINGKRVTLSLDSCYKTTLTADCAQRLGLTVADTGDPSKLVNRRLAEHDGIALIKSFTLGGCEINRTSTIIVLPKTFHNWNSIDGELGLDYLKLNAAIIPVGGTGFLIKPGPVPVVSVRSFLRRLGYKPFSLTATSEVMLLECHIDGRPIQMAIDTGSMYSVVDKASAMDILGPDFAKAVTEHGGANAVSKDILFTPTEFDLGGFNVPPRAIRATESPILKKGATEGLLGQDFLSLHHGIIDLGDDLLWLK